MANVTYDYSGPLPLPTAGDVLRSGATGREWLITAARVLRHRKPFGLPSTRMRLVTEPITSWSGPTRVFLIFWNSRKRRRVPR